MPYRKQQFVNNEIYHLILRGLDGKLLFKDQNDYYRMMVSVYEFNDSRPVNISVRRRMMMRLTGCGSIPGVELMVRPRGSNTNRQLWGDQRQKLVDVLAFCLMPNHVHLLVRQTQENGISKFMSKLPVGYAKYFNIKYQRQGYVWQSRFKSVIIKDTRQLQTIFVYIHTNPIAIVNANWKQRGVNNPPKAIEFVENYQWSSYADYLGKKNFPAVSDREFLTQVMGGVRVAKQQVDDWIKYKGEIKNFTDLFLE